ncbi:unnamed protein product [Timema podura]|uniref:Uncharacterized protein n=1 Tax=Timema podura TaxID=61482 RepID=A0ABN7PHM8_TIMPD|nr:unnamed protein product [Timema podura]
MIVLANVLSSVCSRSCQQRQKKTREVLSTGGSKGQDIETHHKKLTALRAQLASLKEKRAEQTEDVLHVGVIGETETEHKIRLGEMTPFGTTLGSAVSSIRYL